MAKAILALENGEYFEGDGFGAETDQVFELVFNTSMTGYQEIMTDPSYRGQGVLFTVTHLGNVGINLEDSEAEQPQVSAVVTRALSPNVSNWRAALTLDNYLCQHGVPGIQGIDTRAITHRLRRGGTVKAAISTCGTKPETLVEMARTWVGLDGVDMVSEVTSPAAYEWKRDGADPWVERDIVPLKPGLTNETPFVVVYDFGVKRNMIRHLAAWGAKVIVVPATFSPRDVENCHPDGILLSNGPGDPAGLPAVVEIVQGLLELQIPTFGICLGHQLIGRALGAQTKRLRFGHHGGNHPVQDLKTRKVLITAQNHNFVVDLDSIERADIEPTHISLNDQSLEGLRLKNQPVFSVQFHPEAAPGPHDAHGLFANFFALMQERMGK